MRAAVVGDFKAERHLPLNYVEPRDDDIWFDLEPASLKERLPLYLELHSLMARLQSVILPKTDAERQRLTVYLSVARRCADVDWMRGQPTEMLRLLSRYLKDALARYRGYA